jgi:hypothetical protein
MKTFFSSLLVLLSLNSLAQTTRPLVIAAYQQPLEYLAEWKALGVNAVVGPELGNPERVTSKQWCDEAQRLGLSVIGNAFLIRDSYRPPNLIATIVSDEPTSANHNFPVSQIEAEAAAFRRLAPDVPVICNHAGDKLTSAGARDYGLYEGYVRAVDVSWGDWYPVNREFARYPLTFKRDELLFLRARGAKRLGSVIEASWQKLNRGDSRGREPTPEEFETQVNIALANGAEYIVYFTTCDSGAYGWPRSYFPTSPELKVKMSAVNARLNPPAGTQPSAQPTTFPTTQPVPVPTLDDRVTDLERKLKSLKEALQ